MSLENDLRREESADNATKKPRRGKVVKKKRGEAAEFVPGVPAAPNGFDPRPVVENLNLWFLNGTDKYLGMPVNGERRVGRWSGQIVREKLCLADISAKELPGKSYSHITMAMDYLREKRRVEFAGSVAGYPVGIHPDADGQPMAIINSFRLIEPEAGEWPVLRAYFEAHLNAGGIEQAPWLWAWCKTAEAALRAGERRPGLLLALCGPPRSGKSFTQEHILTLLLGGRATDPTHYIMGKTAFNEDVARSEHLMMQELPSVDWKSRASVGEELKKLLVNESMTLHGKYKDPVTVRPFRRVTLSFNDNIDRLKAFPALTSDFADKVLILKYHEAPDPMPTRTDEERALFRETVKNEMPAFIHFLQGWEIPDELRQTENASRFGLDAWQHPEIAEALYEQEPESLILWALDNTAELYEKSPTGRIEGVGWKSEEEFRAIVLAGSCGDRVKGILESLHSMGRNLAKLKDRFPERVKKKKGSRANVWFIHPPEDLPAEML